LDVVDAIEKVERNGETPVTRVEVFRIRVVGPGGPRTSG
jgi:hypothetical protein